MTDPFKKDFDRIKNSLFGGTERLEAKAQEVAVKYIQNLFLLGIGELRPEDAPPIGGLVEMGVVEAAALDKEDVQMVLDELDDFTGYFDAFIDSTYKSATEDYPEAAQRIKSARALVAVIREELTYVQDDAPEFRR